MNKLLMLILVSICLSITGCSQSLEGLKEDRYSLTNEKRQLESGIKKLRDQKKLLEKEIQLDQMLLSNENIKYLLELEVKESHINLTKAVSDTLEIYTFMIPVTKSFYDAQEIGTEIVNGFRLRRVHITVVDKRVEYPIDLGDKNE